MTPSPVQINQIFSSLISPRSKGLKHYGPGIPFGLLVTSFDRRPCSVPGNSPDLRLSIALLDPVCSFFSYETSALGIKSAMILPTGQHEPVETQLLVQERP